MEEEMKTTRFAAGLMLVFVLCTATLSFAQDKDKDQSDQVFDLGDVLVLEKSGDVSQATTTNVISIDDIEQTGAATAAEALEQVPGIDIAVHPKMGPVLKMRGFDQEDVKVLIDGVPAHETYDGFLDLGQIPVDSIAKIEITKGVSSVLYGANTMGGVINIITKKGAKKPITRITTSIGENSTRNVILSHSGSKDKFNYSLTYSHRESDGWDVSDDFDPNNPVSGIGTEYNEDGGVRDLSYYTNQSLNTKIGYEFDTDSKVYLSFDYHNNERGCPTFFSRYWEFDKWEQWHLNLVGEHDITENVTLKARVFYVKHDDGLEDVGWPPDHLTESKPRNKWFERSGYDDYSIGGDMQAYITVTDTNLLKLGATYVKDNHQQQDFLDATCFGVVMFGDPEGYQPKESYAADTYTLAVEDELKLLNEKLTLIAGISYDVLNPKKAYDQPIPDNTTTVNPQLGLVYDVDDTLELHASVGKKTRFPQLKELYSDMAGGNPGLEAQEAISYEIGVDKVITSDLSVSMAIFYNDIENKIDRERISGNWVYVNRGEAENKGLEVTMDYTTPFNLEMGLGYTFLQSTEKTDTASPELDADYTPEHKFTLDLRYRFDFGLTASGQLVYTGEQVEYNEDTGAEETIGGFTLVNLRLNQELTLFESVSPELFLEVDNLFDTYYEEGNGPTPGRSFLVGARVTF